jgi:hypothetical protein
MTAGIYSLAAAAAAAASVFDFIAHEPTQGALMLIAAGTLAVASEIGGS